MYIKKSKNAFSLVEVMLLFVITSLIMAAALPFITRASRPIPNKMAHGMYRCYAVDGGFIEEYYNSYSKISSKQVTACKFEVPKTATLFKIDLIGAGAGGYNYVDVSDDNEEVSAQYYMDSGLQGKAYAEPSELMLKRMFGGKGVKLCHEVKGAGDGGDIKYLAFSPTSFNCQAFLDEQKLWEDRLKGATTQPEKDSAQKNLDNILKKMRDAANWAAARFSGYVQTEALNAELNKYCRDNTLNPATVIVSRDETVNGGTGGKGGYISHVYTIENYSPSKYLSYVDYLKKLKFENKKGYCSDGSCNSFYQYSRYTKTDGALLDLTKNSIEIKTYPANAGSDVNEYSAIKTWDGISPDRYITNETLATAGKGATLTISSDGRFTETEGDDGKNAEGCTASCEESEPYIDIKTNFNKKVHKLGKPGGSGAYKTIVSSNLGDFCTFKIHSGGPIWNDGETKPEDDLATTITCGDFSDSVKGGEYDGGTWSKEYSIANQWTGDPNQEIAPFITDPKQAKPNGYKSNYFWLSYKLGQNNFGQGGDGAGVTDKCTQPTGSYEYKVYDRYGNKPYGGDYSQNFTRKCKNEGVWIQKKDATQGTGGAVIIIW